MATVPDGIENRIAVVVSVGVAGGGGGVVVVVRKGEPNRVVVRKTSFFTDFCA
jgi:hypothetical protein